MKQITAQPAVQKKSKLLEQNIQQYMTEAADVIKKYDFSFTTNFTAPTCAVNYTCQTQDMCNAYNPYGQPGAYFQFLHSLNDKILCGKHGTSEIYVYHAANNNRIGMLNSTSYHLCGILTANGNIVCSLVDNSVVVMTLAGAVVVTSAVTSPRGLHLAANDVIFLAAGNALLKSVDDGCTWKEVFKAADDKDQFWQVVQVKPFMIGVNKDDLQERYWILESTDGVYRLCEYSWSDNHQQVKKREIDSPTGSFSEHSQLEYDGDDSVFVSSFNTSAVQMYSVRKLAYKCNLPISIGYAMGITYDKEKALLFAGNAQSAQVYGITVGYPAKGCTVFNTKFTI